MRTRLFLAVIPLVLPLLLGGCSASDGAPPVETGTATSITAPNGAVEMQPVSNEAALRQVDERLATLPPEEQLRYLGEWFCASARSMTGVYGHVDELPLLQRVNDLSDRYGPIAESLGRRPVIEDSAAEICPGEYPRG